MVTTVVLVWVTSCLVATLKVVVMVGATGNSVVGAHSKW